MNVYTFNDKTCVYTLVVQIMMTKNPLASYLCNCVAEVQRPVLGINRYVENSNKCNERQDLGLPEKKNKTNTLQYVRHVWKNTSFWFYVIF